jgi:hypothetical protein
VVVKMAKLTPKERADHAQKFTLRFHDPTLYDAAAAVIDAREPGNHWAETEKSEVAREVLKGLLEEEMDERLVEAIVDAVAAARQGEKP